MFGEAGQRSPDRAIHSADPPDAVTYGRLVQEGAAVAGNLHQLGVAPGTLVAVLVRTAGEFFRIAAGLSQAGAVMVPLAVPAGLTRSFLSRLSHVLADSGCRFAVVDDRDAGELSGRFPDLRVVAMAEATSVGKATPPPARVAPEDLALIQYTSGSTSAPRGVALTHGNLVAGIRALHAGVRVRPDDVLSHWLPLSHDMGLMATLAAVAAGVDVHVSSPAEFVKRPHAWLRRFEQVRATLHVAPNFGYRLLLEAVPPEEVSTYDLSAARVLLNGAEPIDPRLVLEFGEHFAAAGLDPNALTPCYGLAEATLGVTFAPVDRPARIDWIDREVLNQQGAARPVPPGDPAARGVVDCGEAVAGVQVRVVNDSGGPVPERTVGEVEIRGEPVMRGYYRRPDGEVPADGWCATGDLGYLVGSALHITGRRKEMLIVGGRNYYPEDVEASVRLVPGVYRQHAVAIVLPADPDRGLPERIGVLAEVADARAPFEDLVSALRAAAAEELAGATVEVALLRRNGLLRTTSGKFQRLLMRRLLVSGDLERLLAHVGVDARLPVRTGG